MTKQIERAYRNNRRRSWLLIAAVVALAAIAIPIASGAAEKNYTLGFDTATPVSLTKPICTGATTTVDVYLKNTAKSATLGSAQVTVPSYGTITGASKGNTPIVAVYGSSAVTLNNISLAKNASVKLTVAFSPTVDGSGEILAVVKQSNDFNDAATTANLFSNPAQWPSVQASGCNGTIGGRVWRDSDESRGQNGTEAGQAAWDVYLYESGSEIASVKTDADGDYLFEGVARNRNYVVCEEGPSSSSWAQSTPLTEPALCSTKGHEDAGHSFLFTDDVADKDFGNVNTIGVNCGGAGGLAFTTRTADSVYTIKISSSDCTKSGEFIFEAYANGATERVANLHPVDSAATGAIHVLEKMEWLFAGSSQPDPAGRSLRYDDEAPFDNPQDMPYCLKDPRKVGEFDLDAAKLTDVLPGDDTSCLIATTETAGDASGGTREDIAYTSVDGYRAFP